jgi:SSS family solute:Na+ symporter
MGTIAVVYTTIGGIESHLYWHHTMVNINCGLVFIGIPIAYNAVGGYDVIKQTLAPNIYRSMWNGIKF